MMPNRIEAMQNAPKAIAIEPTMDFGSWCRRRMKEKERQQEREGAKPNGRAAAKIGSPGLMPAAMSNRAAEAENTSPMMRRKRIMKSSGEDLPGEVKRGETGKGEKL